MKRNNLAVAVKMILAGTLATTLVACGGGGGSSSDGGSGDTTASASGTSVGPVSGFGSVYVNGTYFNTDDLGGSITSDDGLSLESELEKGMILQVKADWDDDRNEGRASRVEYDDTLRGALTAFTWDEVENTGSLTVAGQTVVLDGRTVIKSVDDLATVAGAPANYRVRVSAWRQGDGSFRASFVGIRPVADRFTGDDERETEVEGVIADLDRDTRTFTINGLQVDYQLAEFDDDLDGADDLRDGLVVEVEGYLSQGVLMAREIEGDDDGFDNDDDVEISGAIAGDYDANTHQFMLNGVTVQVANGTEFDDGLGEDQLTDGLFVKVEGEYRDGLLYAEEIEAQGGDAELEGMIDSVNLADDRMQVSGVTVAITINTLIEDDDDDDDDDARSRTRDLESLAPGQYVEIEGRQRSDDSGSYLEAFKIEREDDDGEDDDAEVEGRVDEITSDTLTIMGLTLNRGRVSFDGIQARTGDTDGTEVEIDYKAANGGYVITELEIEEDDDDTDE
ncbi:DUF5666 domain-containing protein [Marinobacter zhanjiangensis]|uniref:DUF5666 domain-containing protein n=1 Tax=Marinobacter zhanjiangensis TaxID=578215 RepID=A0ABQ3B6R9_9GAMM|nr:DUF5666 domain-containing protein [Marinobacter zhanjiangensis]GGY81132.1 hypothetical protein GCM10007071_30630 [Marinobacter zhanjiangensis]